MEARIGFEPMNKGFADLSPKITETQCLQGFRRVSFLACAKSVPRVAYHHRHE